MNIARISNGIVINIEVADQEWLDAQDQTDVTFIPYTEEAPARIGDTWDGTVFVPPVIVGPEPIAPEAP